MTSCSYLLFTKVDADQYAIHLELDQPAYAEVGYGLPPGDAHVTDLNDEGWRNEGDGASS